MAVSFRVVNVDSSGYRVYPSQGDPWDKELAEAVVLVARASYALSRELGKPIGTVKVDWPDGTTAIIRVGGQSVTGIVVEQGGQAPSTAGQARAEGLA